MIFLRQNHNTPNQNIIRCSITRTSVDICNQNNNNPNGNNRVISSNHSVNNRPVSINLIAAAVPTSPANSSNSFDYAARATTTLSMNEKLASIGGLLGLLSIVVTGLLLYAIFTTKSQDKWFYIIAVVVNISLLILLMLAAILFDRFYLKKYIFNSNVSSAQPNYGNIAQNRCLYRQMTNDSNQARTSNVTAEQPLQHRTDLPPEYPGRKRAGSADSGVKLISSDLRLPHSESRLSKVVGLDLAKKSEVCADELKSSPQPPNYFDLYPTAQSPSTTTNYTDGNSEFV